MELKLKIITSNKRWFYYGLMILCFALGISFNVWAVQEENISGYSQNLALEKGRQLFFEGRKMFYNAEAGTVEVNNKLHSSREIFGQLPEGFEKYFWQAKVEFLFGRMANFDNDDTEAVARFNTSIRFAEKAMDFNQNNSEIYRLLADSYSNLINIKGIIYGMGYNLKIQRLLNKALSLDKNNYAAYNSLGAYYYYVPPIAGGGIDRAIKTFKKALESKDEFDNFFSNIYLGMSYRKQKKITESRTSLRKALEIYPNSPWAKSILQEVEKE